jgi:hypothetical protein
MTGGSDPVGFLTTIKDDSPLEDKLTLTNYLLLSAVLPVFLGLHGMSGTEIFSATPLGLRLRR